jgi:hypothetical protein
MKPYRLTILASAALLGIAANLPADQTKFEPSNGEQASSMVPHPPQGPTLTKPVITPPTPKTPQSPFRGPNPPPG